MRYLAVAVVAVLSSLVPCRAQNLLPNPEFDHDVSGWREISHRLPVLAWDNTQSVGLGGSALIQIPFGEGGEICILACVPVTPGVVYSFGGQYQLPVQAGATFVQMSLIFASDSLCSSGISEVLSPAGIPGTPPGQWRVLSGPDAAAPPGAVAVEFRACQGSTFDNDKTHTSRFDDLYFGRQGTVGPNQGIELPTLSWTGLFTLTLGLSAAALWVLRRRRATARVRAR